MPTQVTTNDQLSTSDHDTLIRVETKLESLTAEIRNSNINIQNSVTDHETRIRSLENASEVNKGVTAGSGNNRRTLLEITGTLAAIITAVATYMVAKH
jgi:hypothetical protein